MDQNNPYIILNIPYNASISEIKSAYKKLALKHHPDINEGDGPLFLSIKNAYETLTDPKKRRMVDIELLNSNGLIDLKNNTINYQQLLTILTKLEIEVKNPSHSNINKELLGEYLLWVYNENRIYNIILSSPEDEIEIVLSKTLGLLKFAAQHHQLSFYNHLLYLNAHFKKTLIKDQIIYGYISNLRKHITYNKYKLLILLLTSIILCFIIFFASK